MKKLILLFGLLLPALSQAQSYSFPKEHRTVEEQNAKLQEPNQKVDSERSDKADLRQRLEALEKIVLGKKSN